MKGVHVNLFIQALRASRASVQSTCPAGWSVAAWMFIEKRSHLDAGLELLGLRHPAQRAGMKRNAAATTTLVSICHGIWWFLVV